MAGVATGSEVFKVDMQQWTKVLKGMHKADNDLRKAFRKDLRRKMAEVKAAQKAEILARPRVPHEIQQVLAKGLAIEVRERTSRSKSNGTSFANARVRFRSSTLLRLSHQNWPRPESVVGMGKRTNAGEWRHPAWGRPNDEVNWKWYDQWTPSGWFDKPFDARRPEIVRFINATLADWTRRFGGKGYGF